MLQSSTSHNNLSDTLDLVLDLLSKTECRPRELIGQEILLPDIENVTAILAIDSEKNIHLLLTPPAEDEERLGKFNLRGLKICNAKWVVSSRQEQVYLDLLCKTEESPSFERPFLKLAEDCLLEIIKMKESPTESVYRTCVRWKYFWATDVNEVTTEWVYGLLGELKFLEYAIQKAGEDVVERWLGPLGADHDFYNGNDVGFEVKTSTEIPVKIVCNIRQLDQHMFDALYIVCYIAKLSVTGTTLPHIVREIESFLKNNEQILDNFYGKLYKAGYKMQMESTYSSYQMELSDALVYKVDNEFPKITENSFKDIPDHRISGIKYHLQLVGLNDCKLNDVITDIVRLAKN